MKNKYVEEVYKDYFNHLEKLEDNYYSDIYCLIESLEDWNGYGANLKYNIDIKNDYLYIENTKICKMNELLPSCSIETDSVKYQLRNNKYLYIVIQWVEDSDAFISEIYIQNENDKDDCEILYEREK